MCVTKSAKSKKKFVLVQAKAALVDRVFKTYESFKAQGFIPDHHTLTTLLDACQRGKQVQRGQECFDKEFRLHNVEPSVVSWNCLLGVYQQAGDMVWPATSPQ